MAEKELSPLQHDIVSAKFVDLYAATLDKISLKGAIAEGYEGYHELVRGHLTPPPPPHPFAPLSLHFPCSPHPACVLPFLHYSPFPGVSLCLTLSTTHPLPCFHFSTPFATLIRPSYAFLLLLLPSAPTHLPSPSHFLPSPSCCSPLVPLHISLLPLAFHPSLYLCPPPVIGSLRHGQRGEDREGCA